MGWRGPIFHFYRFLVVKLCRRSKNENYAKKGAELLHPQCSVLRLQFIFHGMCKKRLQSVKLESSQSNADRPRKKSGKDCHQTDTLLGKMKITQKKGAELYHPKFLVLRLRTILNGLRKKRPQSVKLKSSQSDNDRPRNKSGKGSPNEHLIFFVPVS